jgi:hypothetical protein
LRGVLTCRCRICLRASNCAHDRSAALLASRVLSSRKAADRGQRTRDWRSTVLYGHKFRNQRRIPSIAAITRVAASTTSQKATTHIAHPSRKVSCCHESSKPDTAQ